MSRFFEIFNAIDHELGCPKRTSKSRSWLPLNQESATHRSLFQRTGACRAEVESIVRQLYLDPAAPVPRVSVFLALEPGVQLRAICAHVADLLASQMSLSVCLIEADPGAPSLRNRLRVPELPGLTDLLADSKLMLHETVAQVPESGLRLLTHGSIDPDGSLFHSQLFEERMEQIRQYFDVVLIDAPSSRFWSNGLALASQADGAVLVLQTGIRRELALERKAELESLGVPLLGVILMDHTFPTPARSSKATISPEPLSMQTRRRQSL